MREIPVGNLGRSSNQHKNVGIQSPKITLSPWKLGVESWEGFIHRFERYASDFQWDESGKLLQLVSCLEGKALAVYRRIDREKNATYDQLRRELECAFSLNAEELGKLFTTTHKKRDESATQFASNVKDKFRNWFSKANYGAVMNVESLFNHVVREQYLQSMPRELKQQIKQKKLVDIDEIADFSSSYFEALSSIPNISNETKSGKNCSSKSNKQENQKSEATNFVYYRCRDCKTSEHHYKQCPKLHKSNAVTSNNKANEKSNTKSGEGKVKDST